MLRPSDKFSDLRFRLTLLDPVKVGESFLLVSAFSDESSMWFEDLFLFSLGYPWKKLILLAWIKSQPTNLKVSQQFLKSLTLFREMSPSLPWGSKGSMGVCLCGCILMRHEPSRWKKGQNGCTQPSPTEPIPSSIPFTIPKLYPSYTRNIKAQEVGIWVVGNRLSAWSIEMK